MLQEGEAVLMTFSSPTPAFCKRGNWCLEKSLSQMIWLLRKGSFHCCIWHLLLPLHDLRLEEEQFSIGIPHLPALILLAFLLHLFFLILQHSKFKSWINHFIHLFEQIYIGYPVCFKFWAGAQETWMALALMGKAKEKDNFKVDKIHIKYTITNCEMKGT